MVYRDRGFFPDILSIITNIKAVLCNNEVNSGKKKTTKQPAVAIFFMQIYLVIYFIFFKFVSVISLFLSDVSENGICLNYRIQLIRVWI